MTLKNQKNTKPAKKPDSPAKKTEEEIYKAITGTEDLQITKVFMCQLVKATADINVNGEDIDKIRLSQDMLEEMKPQDELEGMLAVQMIGLHNMAMSCASYAMVTGQTLEERDMNMRHAARLVNAFTNAMAALDKHRGKGKQKIIVEHQHVQVESGGQAIIGNVLHGGGAKEK